MKTMLAAVVALCGATAVQAESVNLMLTSTGNGRIVRATIGSTNFTVFAGRLNHAVNGNLANQMVTFRTDILQGCSAASSSFTRTQLAQLSGNGGATNVGYAKAQAIADIVAAAAGRQLTLGHDYATAFQVAVWEIVYDFNGNVPGRNLNIAGGTFKAASQDGSALSASIMEKVSFLLGSIGTNASGQYIRSYRSVGFADQFSVVPIPTSAYLGLAGLGLAAVIRRHMKRR